MALAALFAKMVTEAAESMDDAKDAADDKKHAAERTRSTLAFGSFGTLANKHLDSLPKAQRVALEAARASTSIMHVMGEEKGPGHFRLSKRGTGRRFDLTLGDPCKCTDKGRPVGEGESLMLVYWVLTRLLHVGAADEAIAAAPCLHARTVERLLAQAKDVRRRALMPPVIKGQLTEAEVAAALGSPSAGEGDGGKSSKSGKAKRRRGGAVGVDLRATYETDPLVEPGEEPIDWEATLGDTEAVPKPGAGPLEARRAKGRGGGGEGEGWGERVHARVSHFGGMPPITLGAGNRLAAMGSRGTSMASIDTLGQVEGLWASTLEVRRKPARAETFGQTSAPPAGAVRAAGGGGDPFWAAAKANAGSAVFPWRRELHMSEQVALLTKDDTSLDPPFLRAGGGGGDTGDGDDCGDSVFSPMRPAKQDRPGGVPLFGTVSKPGLDATGKPSTRLASLPQFPYISAGGRVVVSDTIVLPAGMGIRHPASFTGDNFQGLLIEYLGLWSTSQDPATKHALGRLVDGLWAKHFFFRAWARAVYGRNKRRAARQRLHPKRFTVLCPNGKCVSVSMSLVGTGLDLKKLLEHKLRPMEQGHKAGSAGRRGFVGQGSGCVLVFEGVPIDDRACLRDAGVRPASTLLLQRMPAQMLQGDDGLPVY